MIKSAIKSLLQADLTSVWGAVTSLHDFSWRSDIISIEVLDERHFKETSKDGYETSFTITVVEPLMKYSFLMNNENLSGEWIGYITQSASKEMVVIPICKMVSEKTTKTIRIRFETKM